MAVVYILYSKSLDKYYVGSCLNLEKRMVEHRSMKFSKSYTGRANDWEVYCVMENLSYHQSRKIEQYIKRMKSRKYLENLKQYPELSENLRERFLE
jgi:putative endonuclease